MRSIPSLVPGLLFLFSGTFLMAQTSLSVTGTTSAEPVSISALPSAASATTTKTYWINNGASAIDCTAGGGAYVVPCKSNGTVWAAQTIGSGSGATTPNTTLPLCGNGSANSTKACVAGTDYVPPGGTVASAMGLSLVNASAQAQLAKIVNGSSGAHLTVALLGHSWVEGKNETSNIITALQNKFGAGGFGYVPVCSSSIAGLSVGHATTGTWTTSNGNAGATITGPDLYACTSSDVSTPATVHVTIPAGMVATGYVIHYYGQAGGGSFTYKTNNGTATTINTGSGCTGYCTVSVSGTLTPGGLSTSGITYTLTAAGTTGVTLFGTDLQNTANGVKIDVLGDSGSNTTNWAAQSTSVGWIQGLAALQPNIVFYQCVVNDWNSLTPLSTFTSNLSTIVSRIRTAVPNADIVLVADPQQGQYTAGATNTIGDYRAALLSFAQSNSVGFVDIYSNWGPYYQSVAAGRFLTSAVGSLSSGITSGSASLALSTTSGTFASGQVALLDQEEILIGSYSAGTASSLTRGYNGTTAAAHSAGATITVTNYHPNADGGTAIGNMLASYLLQGVDASSLMQQLFSTSSPTFNNVTLTGGYTTLTQGADVASASTITPTGPIFRVTGTTTISTINVPASFNAASGTTAGCIIIIPTASTPTDTNGNINRPTTMSAGKLLWECYDASNSVWNPSY